MFFFPSKPLRVCGNPVRAMQFDRPLRHLEDRGSRHFDWMIDHFHESHVGYSLLGLDDLGYLLQGIVRMGL